MSTFSGAVSSAYSLIVFCHLRWDFVWQRPQQFHSRFAKGHQVLFVEGPRIEPGDVAPYYTLHSIAEYPGMTIMQTHFSDAAWGKGGAYVDAMRRELLDKALATDLKGRFDSPVAWFYDPMAVESHLGQHGAIATVYDCMDELSQFRFAPPALIQRERRLLLNADIVFAGGRKMAQAKKRFNTNVHFYGCGVDVAHFGKARQGTLPVPEDIAHLQGKVLGYFGVVDERLDYELIAKIADANLDWNVVMIGPTAKVDPKDFPRRPNLHWLGGRDYSLLPSYTQRFDVALMPFALNEATEYINPTKALEYMATGTPIISTPVPDVVSNFATVCKISTTSEEFVKLACEQAAQTDQMAVERGVKMASENTWDAIVAKMEGHIEDVFENRAQIHSKIRIPIAFPAATAA
ncbi:glycosyltransferase family 1 protein [bacterium]|nr:MAG: glycosyltransferase family 1 protein [bacterium]